MDRLKTKLTLEEFLEGKQEDQQSILNLCLGEF